MTDKQNRAPAQRIYLVKGTGDDARWIEIGAAWPNKDGKGFSLELDAVPLTGRIVMREITAKGEEGGQS